MIRYGKDRACAFLRTGGSLRFPEEQGDQTSRVANFLSSFLASSLLLFTSSPGKGECLSWLMDVGGETVHIELSFSFRSSADRGCYYLQSAAWWKWPALRELRQRAETPALPGSAWTSELSSRVRHWQDCLASALKLCYAVKFSSKESRYLECIVFKYIRFAKLLCFLICSKVGKRIW